MWFNGNQNYASKNKFDLLFVSTKILLPSISGLFIWVLGSKAPIQIVQLSIYKRASQ